MKKLTPLILALACALACASTPHVATYDAIAHCTPNGASLACTDLISDPVGSGNVASVVVNLPPNETIDHLTMTGSSATWTPTATLVGKRYTVTATNNGATANRLTAEVSFTPTVVGDNILPHEALLHGVPSGYDWYAGPVTHAGNTVPGGWTAMTGWGIVYSAASGNPATNTRVEIASIKELELDGTGWHTLSLSPGSTSITGKWYPEDMGSAAPITSDSRVESDGGISASAGIGSGSGRTYHFFPIARQFNTSPINGVLVVIWARLILTDSGGTDDRATANYLACAGADYWIDKTSPFAGSLVNNTSIGVGRCKIVPRDGSWRPFYLTTLSNTALRANPPPLDGPPS